ncbi:N-acetylglutamate synthase, GNAT family [Halorientalis persicus]|jgi:N-acetylglutamate synthase-like GNAT family acetyltransferase|uniref:N-acetylglutamate synthase, GNAT family n=1 Tax=Halorientalis persicus TaxID=1367881 RepID=A0A1H8T5E2_9EURY|nr:GNAT family N-acetyltransferase [Halorientalis persicus]SEO85916.1 N-acetylglutamate synthase, GNAT family [Halorientalis persicus]
MYVRDAKNREEVWLLDHIEDMGLDETAFRSRDYVIAIDEETNEKAGFGRIRVHKADDEAVCELTSIGVLDDWRGQGIGAHVVERLIQKAGDEGFETVYSLTDAPDYLRQFEFEPIDAGSLPEKLQDRLDEKREATAPDAVPMALSVAEFRMPRRFREAFKRAAADEGESEPEEGPEDFGIDPDEATYKYDTGR